MGKKPQLSQLEMQSITDFTTKFEAQLDKAFAPIKPMLPGVARFLLVVTFLEDTVRLVSQWKDQTNYLTLHRRFPYFLAALFLLTNITVMSVGSMMAIFKKKTEIAVGMLAGVIVIQAIGYGLIFDSNFFLRNMSVMGGLLMLLAESYSNKRRNLFAGLPSLNEEDKTMYMQLFGRILLVFLVISVALNGEMTFLRLIVSLIGLVGCVMVVVGFKAKYSAWMMITFLSVSNVLLNNWWSLHHAHPQRDFRKYDFFQTLSIMGGFLLLANLGAGSLSVDEKKKQF